MEIEMEEIQSEVSSYSVGSIVSHPKHGKGRIAGYDQDFYVVHFPGESRKVPKVYRDLTLVEVEESPDISKIKQAVREVLGDNGWLDTDLEMGNRWVGGSVKIIPGKEGTQSKEIPIEAFFKKIISVREKLRVLEQKINNHKSLNQEEKIDLEGYISRCYGSLTSFNVLFAHKRDQFSSSTVSDSSSL